MLPGQSLAPLERRSDRPSRETLVQSYVATRRRTEALAAPLSAEDQTVQSMPEASPTKWHRAHTSWFFEAFLLAPRGVEPVDPRYGFLFNSYYEAMGPRLPREHRGLVSRPSVAEIAAYRAEVDARVVHLLASLGDDALREVEPIVSLGLAHEEQHQELLLTDILHALSRNPLLPAYRDKAPAHGTDMARPIRFVPFPGGIVRIGASAKQPFAFDNERPRHARWLEPFAIGDRLVTVGEVRAFIAEAPIRTSPPANGTNRIGFATSVPCAGALPRYAGRSGLREKA